MSAAVIDDALDRRRRRAMRVRGLYAVTPELADTQELVARVDAVLAGGATAIQYRSKWLAPRERHAQAAALARVVAARGALLIINDDAELAAAVDADGVHLGEDDGGIDRARRILGPARILGVSCYNDLSRAEAAVADGADYIAFGSFFASGVKPDARRAEPSLLDRARRFNVPIVAIGGITADNAGGLVRAGADAVAVISAVFGSSDVTEIEHAARALCAAMAARDAA
ncbi:MAG: thiamine phosphate synthase [Acidobacteriota bacterium]